ncbi:MAG: translation initiation factor IF-2 subunit beta [Candidatus Nezhaarchaeota archaeon]|nr:translation initiation factor IF-2 subunit beta [Candidatus Nezhaarchaeota archaeon]
MSIRDYERLLERALLKVPAKPSKSDRFELPKSQIMIIGGKTIIHNFKDIADTLNRDLKHLFQFLLHELGTAGVIEEGRALLHGKFTEAGVNSLIERYAKMYVMCPVCNKVDTELKKEGRVTMIVCGACGAISPARG